MKKLFILALQFDQFTNSLRRTLHRKEINIVLKMATSIQTS